MNIDRTTCWYNKENTPEQMIKGSNGQLWPILEQSEHFPILCELLEKIPYQYKDILDIGCGAGDIGRVFSDYSYLGLDLTHIIENVSKKRNPNLRYLHFDIYNIDELDIDIFKEAGTVLMNAFIDVLEHPVECLNKVLSMSNHYILLHRQNLTQSETYITRDLAYGGETYQTFINEQEFHNVIKENSFQILDHKKVHQTSNSFLLKRI